MSNTHYDEFYSMGKGMLQYPALLITQYDELALSVLLDGLFSEDGDLPVIIDYKGKLTKLGAIKKTPAHVQRFLRVARISVLIGRGDVRPVSDITDLLEMEDFSWMR